MFLARELGMTRRQLLNNVNSYELAMWQAYFKETNKPYEKKQTPEEIACKLKNVFAVKQAQGKKKKKNAIPTN